MFRKQKGPEIRLGARYLLGTKRNNSFIASSGREWGGKQENSRMRAEMKLRQLAPSLGD